MYSKATEPIAITSQKILFRINRLQSPFVHMTIRHSTPSSAWQILHGLLYGRGCSAPSTMLGGILERRCD